MSGQFDAFETALPVPAPVAFAWHDRPGALRRLLPPWQSMRVLRDDASLQVGSRVVMQLRFVGLPMPRAWHARHVAYEPPHVFEDIAERGPFAHWRHRHRFLPAGPDGVDARLRDEVQWSLPFAAMTQPLLGRWVRGELQRMFDFRHRRTREDLQRHAAFDANLAGRRLRVGITGATGAIGAELTAFLQTGGHHVVGFGRRPGQAHFDAEAGTIDAAALDGLDVVVHLAGTTIGQRWTDAAQRSIRRSREVGTRALAEAMASRPDGPRRLVSVSAVGWYGDRTTRVDADSEPGQGFAAEVAAAWEGAAEPARAAGLSVVNPRMAVVLDPRSGALHRMLPAFRAGVGGPVGHGRQAMPWIALDDAVYGLAALAVDPALALEGPVDLVAPQAVAQAEFARTLGRVLGRPAVLPLPALAVRTLFGAMGDELLLRGAPVHPTHLLRAGFRFAYPDLEGALRHLLGYS
ncbi:MAG: hypothetical protein RIT45_1267 [Pseudomonadota bacterium]|jgi:uncharacterized protein (TIGR01777 family)